MLEYPAWRYRKTDHHTVVVHNKEEDQQLSSDWLAELPEGFNVHQPMPTYRAVEFVVNPIDMDKIEQEVTAKERGKPGPKPKAK